MSSRSFKNRRYRSTCTALTMWYKSTIIQSSSDPSSRWASPPKTWRSFNISSKMSLLRTMRIWRVPMALKCSDAAARLSVLASSSRMCSLSSPDSRPRASLGMKRVTSRRSNLLPLFGRITYLQEVLGLLPLLLITKTENNSSYINKDIRRFRSL